MIMDRCTSQKWYWLLCYVGNIIINVTVKCEQLQNKWCACPSCESQYSTFLGIFVQDKMTAFIKIGWHTLMFVKSICEFSRIHGHSEYYNFTKGSKMFEFTESIHFIIIFMHVVVVGWAAKCKHQSANYRLYIYIWKGIAATIRFNCLIYIVLFLHTQGHHTRALDGNK